MLGTRTWCISRVACRSGGFLVTPPLAGQTLDGRSLRPNQAKACETKLMNRVWPSAIPPFAFLFLSLLGALISFLLALPLAVGDPI